MPELITLPEQFVTMYENQSLADLLVEFQTLDTVLDHVEHETRKLIILKIVNNRLRTKQNRPIELIPVEGPIPFWQHPTLLTGLYQFCFIFGGLEKAAGSFVDGLNLFLLIPGINPILLYALTITYILLDAVLFYAFEVSFLKKALGVSLTQDDRSLLNQIYLQQVEFAKEIHIGLHDRETTDWDPVIYEEYCSAMRIFNGHLLKKDENMGVYPSSTFWICVEKGVVMFGALAVVADSYFMTKTALLLLHISFMSSPFGFILVLGMIGAVLGIYYSMGAQSMSELVNPDRQSYNDLKEGLTIFKRDYASRAPYMPKNRVLPVQLTAPEVSSVQVEVTSDQAATYR